MAVFSIFRDYLVWHYGRAYEDMFHIWWNYLWFVNHLFSVPEVIKSWLSPFKRLQEDKVNIIKDPQAFFANMFVNIIMRIVGAALRTALITIALIGFTVVMVLGLLALVTWTALPLLIAHFLITGFELLLF